jgi:CBS-domain-containing membrane protein
MPKNSKNALANYFGKMRATTISPPRVSPSEILWSWVGGFCGIGAVSFINFNLIEKTDLLMVIGSFGASAVLIYGVIDSPLAQPRNLVGGHLVSALTGVTVYKILHPYLWLAAAVAVATAIAAMHATRTAHPPGGATALIAVIGSAKVHALGYLYVIVPAGLGATVMLVVALLVNNIPNTRKYPRFWY